MVWCGSGAAAWSTPLVTPRDGVAVRDARRVGDVRGRAEPLFTDGPDRGTCGERGPDPRHNPPLAAGSGRARRTAASPSRPTQPRSADADLRAPDLPDSEPTKVRVRKRGCPWRISVSRTLPNTSGRR